VRQHRFPAATDNLDYSVERIKVVQKMLLGGSGIPMDKFRVCPALIYCALAGANAQSLK
jgi:hypothetical protein